MKLVVAEAESPALAAALAGHDPYLTSTIGEIETARVCRRAGIPSAQIDRIRTGLAVVPLDAEIALLALSAGPTTLRTLDAIHLATAIVLGDEIDAVVTYDGRLADAASSEGLTVLSPA